MIGLLQKNVNNFDNVVGGDVMNWGLTLSGYDTPTCLCFPGHFGSFRYPFYRAKETSACPSLETRTLRASYVGWHACFD